MHVIHMSHEQLDEFLRIAFNCCVNPSFNEVVIHVIDAIINFLKIIFQTAECGIQRMLLYKASFDHPWVFHAFFSHRQLLQLFHGSHESVHHALVYFCVSLSLKGASSLVGRSTRDQRDVAGSGQCHHSGLLDFARRYPDSDGDW